MEGMTKEEAREIPAMLQEIDKASGVLTEAVNDIASRLEPIMSPEEPEPETKSLPREPCKTALGGKLDAHRNSLLTIIYRISAMTSRLEI